MASKVVRFSIFEEFVIAFLLYLKNSLVLGSLVYLTSPITSITEQ